LHGVKYSEPDVCDLEIFATQQIIEINYREGIDVLE
jgi:hypothetical protein